MTSQSSKLFDNKEFQDFLLLEKKILQLVPSLNQGGVEKGTIEVAHAILKAGGTAFVASKGGAMTLIPENQSILFLKINLQTKNPLLLIKNIFSLYHLIKKHQINLVHARSRAPAWSGWIAARLAKVPFMTTFHGTYNFKSSIKRFYNSIMVRGDHIIAISPFIQRHIQKNYSSFINKNQKITMIPRGVDEKIFDPFQSDLSKRIELLKQAWNLTEDQRPFLLLPGRLTRWKGQEVALEALKILKSFSGTLIFLGSDQGRSEYSQKLKDKAQIEGLNPQVRFINQCFDMPAAYGMADLVLHTSIDPEAFGRVIIEAQAMGKCVIATDHGAPPDIILSKVTGYLVPPHDPAALAEYISHYFALSALEQQALSQQARAHICAHFSKQQMLDKTLKVYYCLLSSTTKS